MLRQTHPQLAYHVFDATSSNWKRNDYPHYLLYQQNVDTSRIENWQPSGPEPDQMYCANTKGFSAVPYGSVAVVIHPAAQAKIDEDPEFARQVYERIEAWFAFDEARNAAAMGGYSGISCRSIAIGEDGEIANVQAFGGGSFRAKPGGSDTEDEHGKLSWWDKQARRFAKYMQAQVERQLEHAAFLSQQLTEMSMASSARMKLRSIIRQKDLLDKLGATVAGTDTIKVLEATAQTVFGSSFSTLLG